MQLIGDLILSFMKLIINVKLTGSIRKLLFKDHSYKRTGKKEEERRFLFWCHLPIWPLGARVDLPKVRGSAITNSYCCIPKHEW